MIEQFGALIRYLAMGQLVLAILLVIPGFARVGAAKLLMLFGFVVVCYLYNLGLEHQSHGTRTFWEHGIVAIGSLVVPVLWLTAEKGFSDGFTVRPWHLMVAAIFPTRYLISIGFAAELGDLGTILLIKAIQVLQLVLAIRTLALVVQDFRLDAAHKPTLRGLMLGGAAVCVIIIVAIPLFGITEPTGPTTTMISSVLILSLTTVVLYQSCSLNLEGLLAAPTRDEAISAVKTSDVALD